MGADLVGYLVIGPSKLDPDLRQTAIDKARTVIEVAKTLTQEEFLGDRDDPNSRISGLLRQYPWVDNLLEIFEAEELDATVVDRDPEKCVADLYEFWPGNARDAVARELGDGVMVFAGEMTWGDDPQGFGYQTLKSAYYLRLFEIFGIS